jgi:hypothetical protein
MFPSMAEEIPKRHPLFFDALENLDEDFEKSFLIRLFRLFLIIWSAPVFQGVALKLKLFYAQGSQCQVSMTLRSLKA